MRFGMCAFHIVYVCSEILVAVFYSWSELLGALLFHQSTGPVVLVYLEYFTVSSKPNFDTMLGTVHVLEILIYANSLKLNFSNCFSHR